MTAVRQLQFLRPVHITNLQSLPFADRSFDKRWYLKQVLKPSGSSKKREAKVVYQLHLDEAMAKADAIKAEFSRNPSECKIQMENHFRALSERSEKVMVVSCRHDTSLFFAEFAPSPQILPNDLSQLVDEEPPST